MVGDDSKLIQNNLITDDDKQGIDIAEFLLKNLQNNVSMDAVLNDSYVGQYTDLN